MRLDLKKIREDAISYLPMAYREFPSEVHDILEAVPRILDGLETVKKEKTALWGENDAARAVIAQQLRQIDELIAANEQLRVVSPP